MWLLRLGLVWMVWDGTGRGRDSYAGAPCPDGYHCSQRGWIGTGLDQTRRRSLGCAVLNLFPKPANLRQRLGKYLSCDNISLIFHAQVNFFVLMTNLHVRDVKAYMWRVKTAKATFGDHKRKKISKFKVTLLASDGVDSER